MPKITVTLAALLLGLLTILAPTPALATTGPSGGAVARAHFTHTDDSSVLGTREVGEVLISQKMSGGTINVRGIVRGLLPSTTYVIVDYKDPVCLFDPTVTAYPSSAFTTDAQGSARVVATINPTALNPAGQFDVSQSMSVSTRQVVTNAAGQNVPFAVPEACDGSPAVHATRG